MILPILKERMFIPVYLGGISAVVCPPCALTAIAGTAMYSLVLEPMLFPEPKVIPMTK